MIRKFGRWLFPLRADGQGHDVEIWQARLGYALVGAGCLALLGNTGVLDALPGTSLDQGASSSSVSC